MLQALRQVFGASPAAEPAAAQVSRADLIAERARGAALPLRARRVRAGQSGSYVSTFRGRGMEYAESRPYQPGDDPRSLDWRVMARSGKPFTKQFREERERPVMVAVDLRPDMHFATRGCFKSVFVARAAALIAWSSLAHGDRLGGLLFDGPGPRELRPASGKRAVLHFLDQLTQAAPGGGDTGHIGEAVRWLRRVTRPGSLVFLLSDFHDIDAAAEAELRQLGRHADVILLGVADPLEAELPPPGDYVLESGGRRLRLETRDPQARQRYRQQFLLRQHALERLGRQPGLRAHLAWTTDEPLAQLQQVLGVAP